MDDEQLTALLDRAVAPVQPRTEVLVAGGIARGRRRRRLVRGAEALTGLLVAAGVAALVVALVPSGSPETSSIVAGHTRSNGAPHAKPATVAMTPQALLQTAIDTLPRPGTTSHYDGNFMPGWASTQFVYNDGHGAAQIYVSIGYPPYSDDQSRPCPPGGSCVVLPDGAHAGTAKSREYPDSRTPNATEWVVHLVRRDGVQVAIMEFNAPQEKGAALSRVTPPFSLAELTHWADGPQWQKQISAQRANDTSHLFKPDDLDAPAKDTPLTGGQSASVQARNCALAKKIHKTPPAYCVNVP